MPVKKWIFIDNLYRQEKYSQFPLQYTNIHHFFKVVFRRFYTMIIKIQKLNTKYLMTRKLLWGK